MIKDGNGCHRFLLFGKIFWWTLEIGFRPTFIIKKAGPCHHIEELTKSCGSRPRDKMSARFSADLTWYQSLGLVICWIWLILLATKTDHLRDGKAIQFRTIVESDHKNICMPVSENDASIFLISLANNNAAESSRRGSDTALRDATRDFEHNNLVWYVFSSVLVRI